MEGEGRGDAGAEGVFFAEGGDGVSTAGGGGGSYDGDGSYYSEVMRST